MEGEGGRGRCLSSDKSSTDAELEGKEADLHVTKDAGCYVAAHQLLDIVKVTAILLLIWTDHVSISAPDQCFQHTFPKLMRWKIVHA